MFIEGEKLTSQEIVDRMGITRRMWDTKRKKYLAHLEKYYDIDIEGYGMSRKYYFKRQKAEYEDYVSPRDKKLMESKYQEIILNEITRPGMELQLYSTMNDRVIATRKVERFKHQKKTSYNYVSNGMKEMFGKEVGDEGTCGQYINRVWAKQLFNEEYDFERLSKVEEENWIKIIKENMTIDYSEIYSMYENKEINKDDAMFEMFESGWFKFQCAKQIFFDLYGFVPIRVKEYLVGGKKGEEDIV